MKVAAVSGFFGRDLEECFGQAEGHIAAARRAGVQLLVLPEASLGGYLQDLSGDPRLGGLPPLLEAEGPELRRLAAMAGDLVVCAGYTELGADGSVFNAAACVSGEGVLGIHHKVHLPLNEGMAYGCGSGFDVIDTPVGPLGMVICYDKAFPEAVRTLALGGAEIVACMSAWPCSRTAPAERLEDDRQSRLFDLFDCARAAENQLVWVSANQWGSFGDLRFLGRAKVVSPGGDILAATGCGPGMAVADIDSAAVATSRRSMHHLRDRRPAAYRLDEVPVG